MKRKILALFSIGVLSFSLVACSNKEKTLEEELIKKESQQEDAVFEKPQKEEIIFDEEVVIVDEDEDITVTVKGKSKIIQGDSVGYMYNISNMSDESIEFYVKDVKVDGVPFKTDLEKGSKMPLPSLAAFSTQMTFRDIISLEDLKNTTGTFCIKTNEGVKEYEFELE